MQTDDTAPASALPAPTRPGGRAPLTRVAPTGRRRQQPGRRVWVMVAWFIVMLAFTAFFVVPVIWLLLAPTKSDHQIGVQEPPGVRVFPHLIQTWDKMLVSRLTNC